jgi:hypothetical protein
MSVAFEYHIMIREYGLSQKLVWDTQITYVKYDTLGFYGIFYEVIEVKPSETKFFIMNY